MYTIELHKSWQPWSIVLQQSLVIIIIQLITVMFAVVVFFFCSPYICLVSVLPTCWIKTCALFVLHAGLQQCILISWILLLKEYAIFIADGLLHLSCIHLFITLRASCGAVYCNRSRLWVCLWVCYHDNSRLHASILTKLGVPVKVVTISSWLNFGRLAPPGKGVCGKAIFFSSALL